MSILPQNIHPSWNSLLTDEFVSKLNDIERIIDAEPTHECGHKYFPLKQNIMRFLSQDLTVLKCVIVGMEPYPSWYYDDSGNSSPVATGKSFEIANVDDWEQKFKQSSLRNMLKTVYYNKTGKNISLSKIRDEIKNGNFNISQPHEWFDNLEKQGVMFLNATLTVRPNSVDTHTSIWCDVMDIVIHYIDENSNTKWLLFGNKAQERVIGTIGDTNCYKSCHPRLANFVTENPFKNITNIEWSI